MSEHQIVVVGGGLSGLLVACRLARAGRRVTICERSHALGGRAMTLVDREFYFNLGPHALYRKAQLWCALEELGMRVRGHVPPTKGLFGLRRGRLETLPASPASIFTTGLLKGRSRWQVLRFFLSITLRKPNVPRDQTVAQWLRDRFSNDDARELLAALFRVATYANDPEHMSAQAALEQVRRAVTANVWYLDGGWQQIVDGLVAIAEGAGVTMRTDCPVRELLIDNGRTCGVRVASGEELRASSVVLALPSAAAAALLPGGALTGYVAGFRPVRAACLDVALTRLPAPGNHFILGIDEPLYASVHSAVAQLAPEGGATVVLARYLSPDESVDRDSVRAQLEELCERLQPGWRECVAHTRFRPVMTVADAVVTPVRRPDVGAVGIPGVWLVGDWVGADGMLADAAAASARRVVE